MTYIAFTTGPIVKTLNQAKKTRELWAASYIFSYMVKEIIASIKKECNGIEFVLPFVPDEMQEAVPGKILKEEDNMHGAGIYPDRFIIKWNNITIKDIESIIEECLNKIADEISKTIKENKNEIYTYIKDYFRFCLMEIELNDKDNSIIKISPYLDALELQESYVKKEKTNYISEFLEKSKDSSFAEECFGKDRHFESLIEISARELFSKIDEGEKKEIIYNCDEEQTIRDELLKRNDIKGVPIKKQFKEYHDYAAIVQSDGDSFGKYIEKIGTDLNELKVFTEKLYKFIKQAVKLIDENGGRTIYAGGDDLLFFAPLVNGDKNIFHLINEIDNIFQNLIGKNAGLSLSYGVSITHWKYPLYEALEEARSLLFSKAKKVDGKDAIAFKVLKHSGKYFECALNKSGEVYKYFTDNIVNNILNESKKEVKENDRDKEKEKRFLRSIPQKLDFHRSIIKRIGTDKDRLNNFFNNTFNEEIHKKKEIKEFLQQVQELILKVYKEDSKNDEKSNIKDSEKLKVIYCLLRMHKALKGYL